VSSFLLTVITHSRDPEKTIAVNALVKYSAVKLLEEYLDTVELGIGNNLPQETQVPTMTEKTDELDYCWRTSFH
jgi:hypothetical protein